MKMRERPPKAARWLLNKTMSRDVRYSALGDFEEIFFEMVSEKGILAAYLWYWTQAFKSLPAFTADSIHWSIIMLSNYFKIAFRNMRRQKLNTLLNLSGLSLGVACTVLILFHVYEELSYSKFLR